MAPTHCLPLRAASERLRGKPGRPRTRPPAPAKADPLAVAALRVLTPRLVDLESAARYLGGISTWSVRDLLDTGRLHRVRLPGPGGADFRRVLIDVQEIDALIAASKDPESRRRERFGAR
jgi:hypothetical protein